MTTARELLPSLKGVKKSGDGWIARCPAHNDKNPSLSIGERDGKLLLNCFAGCEFQSILAALPHTNGKAARREVAAYSYTDEAGNLEFQVVRFEPKEFRSRKPGENGEWEWKLGNARRVLYRLRELLAADPAETVYIGEGEKDSELLIRRGLVATCNPHGAGKWRDSYSKTLRGRKVVILPDNDEPGRKHAEQVANSLHGIAASIKIVELPGLPEKGDVSDWLDAGNGIKKLRELTEATPLFEPLPESKPVDPESKPKKSKRKQQELFPDIEAWPEAVNGAELLDEIVALMKRYVDASEAIYRAAALWALFTYVFDSFFILPILLVISPTKRSGKTTLLQVLDAIVCRSLITSSISAAALFRAIEEFKPTLLIDEADTFLNDDENLRGIVNSGHSKKSAVVIRCDENFNVSLFSTFCPKAVAMIGKPKETITDRSIPLQMKRAPSNQKLEYLRADKLAELGAALCSKAVRFAADNSEALKKVDPEIPAEITNARARDNWRSLLGLANVCGGRWPRLAREAATELSGGGIADDESIAEMLLSDIRQVYSESQTDRLFSKTLVARLLAIGDRPWPEANDRKPITETWLARRLKPFGITSNTLRFENDRAKGYELHRFEDAFSRYLTPSGDSILSSVTRPINIDESAKSKRDTENDLSRLENDETHINIELSRLRGSIRGGGSKVGNSLPDVLVIPASCPNDEESIQGCIDAQRLAGVPACDP